jgi:hypothetical protein
MNPHGIPSFEELATAVRWHGYVCVTLPGLVASEMTTWGWGESTYRAMMNAAGQQLADSLCEVIDNGGRMTHWSPVMEGTITLLRCELVNDQGNTLCAFYK